MCGIIALLLADKSAFCRQELYDGLTILQHRGQDAAGMATASLSASSAKYHIQKGQGLVRDVFSQSKMQTLIGNTGLGHCRYPTAGSLSSEEAQPMYVNYPCGLALAHNGNLTTYESNAEWVRQHHRHLNTSSDSEVLLNVFGEMLRKQLDKKPLRAEGELDPDTGVIFSAVEETMDLCGGGYSVVMLIHDVGVVAFRDRFGIRPLVIGKRNSNTLKEGIDYCIASESVVLDTLGFELIRDVRPGECVLCLPMIPGHPRTSKGLYSNFTNRKLPVIPPVLVYPCLFEYVYFARPDSFMNGVSVYESRLKMGEKLAKKILDAFVVPSTSLNGNSIGDFDSSTRNDVIKPLFDVDVVIPVPDTSRTCALRCAQVLGLPYYEGFIKNRYIGRTFIMPEQSLRQRSIRLKLNTIKCEFKDRNVLLVDDSIVRGNTSKQLVTMAREAGAKKVYFASAAPEVRFPNVYGIDIPTKGELVVERSKASSSGVNGEGQSVAQLIGADMVVFQGYQDLEDAVKECEDKEYNKSVGVEIAGFEGCTFTGKYLTGDVDELYFQKLQIARGQSCDTKIGT